MTSGQEPRHSTRRRLLVLVISVTGLALVVMLIGMGVFNAMSSRQALVERTRAEAGLIAGNAASALAFGDSEFATSVLASLSVVPEVVGACLFDSEGEVFSTYLAATGNPDESRSTCPSREPPNMVFAGEYLESYHDVLYEGAFVGTLYLKSRTTSLAQLLLQYVAVALLATSVAMAAALLLTSRLQRRISEPLETLIRAANRVRRQRDYTARAAKYRDDELGRLTDTFNAMLEYIEKAKLELEASEQRYRDLFNTPLVGILSIDVETGAAHEANTAAARLLGYDTVEQLTEQFSLMRHFPDLADGGSLRQELLKSNQLLSVQIDFHDIRGRLRSADFSARWVTGTSCVQVALVDTTERRASEHQVRELERQVRHQQKLESIGTLASGVAHEINNPIQAIMGQAELLSLESDVNENVTRAVEAILEQAERVAGIVSSLLTFARKEQESQSLEKAQTIARDTLRLMSTVFRNEDIHLDVALPKEDLWVTCDRQQIQQVLINLMTNARDALNERYDKPCPDKRLRLELRTVEFEGASWVRFTVEDRGAGIPSHVRERIFDPFFTTKLARGTGLGLSIGHGIVTDHGGRLTFETEEGAYTRFHVDLPLTLLAACDRSTLNDSGGARIPTRGALRVGRGR